MKEEQPTVAVTPATLVEEVTKLRDQGWRLVQIGVTQLSQLFEVNYTFDLQSRFLNLRLQIPSPKGRLPSVSGVYWCAFLYENEIHDLFGISFDGLALDFNGNLYKTAKPFPLASSGRVGVSTSVVQSV